MGYRVKNQCFQTLEAAHDYVMSDVQPVLTQDGTILAPVKILDKWYFQGNEIVLTFPECSYSEQIYSGLSFGAYFISLFALMFCFKAVYKFIQGLNVNGG